MENLAERLRRARQEKNISLKEINEKTKIHLRLLEAIENGDLSPFDGEVYIIGALRNYAEVVGLDPQEIANQYKQIKAEYQEEEKEQKDSQPTWRNKSKSSPPFPYAITAVVALLVLVVSAGIWLSLTDEEINDENNDEVVERDNDNEEEIMPEPYEPEEPDNDEEAEPEIIKVEATGGESYWEVEGADKLQIVINLEEDCWIRADADGERILYDTYRAGEELQIEASEEIFMRTGYTPGMRLKVNDQEIDDMTEYDDVHEYYFSIR